jgi:hypothetical protein
MTYAELAGQALQARLSLIRALSDEEIGLKLIALLHGSRAAEHLSNSQLVAKIETVQQQILYRTVRCPTFVLPPDECQLLSASWREYPTLRVEIEDSIAPRGMVFFDNPIPDPAPRPGLPELPVRALWWDIKQGSDPDMDLYLSDERSWVLKFIVYADTDRINNRLPNLPKIFPYLIGAWVLSSNNGGILVDEMGNPGSRGKQTLYLRMLLSYWAIIRQQLWELDELREEQLPRKIGRRVANVKKHRKGLDSSVRVTRFRPRTGSGDRTTVSAPSGRRYSVRFGRRPYWRWQWYPSLGVNKPVLVYTKKLIGPEGAPIVGEHRFFLSPKPLRPKHTGLKEFRAKEEKAEFPAEDWRGKVIF